MNNPAKKPTPRDREYLQAELTRMVGIGRIGLETFQQLVDTTLETEDTAVLAQIHARYIGPPPPEWAPPTPQSPPQPPKDQLWPRPGAQAPPPQHPPAPGPGPQYLPQSQPGQFSGPPPQPMQPFGQASPQQGYHPQPGYPAPQPVQHLSSTVGSIKRTGQWLVPEHALFRLNGATLDLDLREATASGPVVTFEIKAIAATIKIVVPPGVHVTNNMKETWTESTLNVTAPTPGAPRVVLIGTARGSTIEVVTRALGEKGFWEKLFGG